MMKKIVSAVISCVLTFSLSNTVDFTASAENRGKFTSTFIQSWLCRDWTAQRWEQEFESAKEAGFDSLILQSVCELSYTQNDTSASKQDSSSYTCTSAYSMYPSELEALEGCTLSVQNDGDALELALESARKTGMKLWIGTVSDDRWWNYGWGVPEVSASGVSYLLEWCLENVELCSDVITEIQSRYGEEYSDTIAGFYYVNEIWNIDVACAGTDNGEYASLLGKNMNYSIDACGDKPLMISPFFNPDLSDAEQYGDFWRDIFKTAQFRPQDIFAHQDGGGRGCTPEEIRQWAQELKKAVDEEGMRFWINNETFQGDYQSKSIAELKSNYEAVSDLAQEHILFSWNHYYNPLVNSEFQTLSDEFTGFAIENASGDVNSDGEFNIADAVMLQNYLVRNGSLADWTAGDLCDDNRIDVFDLIAMKRKLTSADAEKNYVDVSTVEELFLAMRNAQPGDVIRVASGTYDYTTYQGAQKIDTSAEGTENAPITLTAKDPENPPVITGTNPENGYVLQITGDYWIIENLKITTSQKGIVLDNSNHSVIRNCEVYNIGSEAVAIRDGSSYCTVKDSYIHDTGVVTPGYGEGVYIGSAKSVTGFDYKCDYNTVDGCTFKNVSAEHVDVKEYTTGTEIMNCTFYGDGMTGANYAGSFVDIAGNNVNVHHNIGYRNGNSNIVASFELHLQVEEWGYHCTFTDNTLYMDRPYGEVDTSRRMYVVDGWYSDFSVKNNMVDYGQGLVEANSWEFYNSDYVTYLE